MPQSAVTPPVVLGSPSGPLAARSILITGGSGAFGQAFARHALDHGARRVMIFSRGEAAQAAMRAAFRDDRLRFAIGDVRDADRVMDACRGVDTVIHAAALKRVEVCEAEPSEAIATNVTGTLHVVRACLERGVERAVFLSTDKAAAPNTCYGATKLTAERAWLGSNVAAAGTPTRFAATRYGNVLGSTGSVVPLWRAQVARGETVTVTDPRCSRFWMTMAEAVELVCLALATMRGGETFVPKIGSAPIAALVGAIGAKAITVTGLRPAEKIHETLITADEARRTHDCGTHYVIEPSERTWGVVPPLPFPLVPEDFVYGSDTNPHRYTMDDLERLVA